MTDGPGAAAPRAAELDGLREFGDLKRVRSAGRAGSIAERLFARAWGALLAGARPEALWPVVTGQALAATRLGDLDEASLGAVGLDPASVGAVQDAALAEACAGLEPHLAASLRDARQGWTSLPAGPPPPFAARLAGQPRAGVTAPGRPRLLLEPPENHAEHCLMVAVYGVLLSPREGAEPATVFLAALAHHLHNALLPDSGFAGEVLLGEHLAPAFARATEAALSELPAPLGARVREATRVLPDAETPEGRAFHAADTLDRVLQIEQHLRAGRATMRHVLHDMALVHEGPVKPFQDRVLAAYGLL